MNPRIISRTGWPLLLTLIAVPILLWATMVPLSSRFETPYLTLTNVGGLAGITAMVLFCLNIVLTSRLRILEKIFGGLNKMYIAHHLIGGFALCILLVHPLMFALRATTITAHDAALILLPFTTDWATTFGVLALWLFITLMLLTFYVKLPYRLWLLTHKFLGLVLFGIILHTLLGSNDIANSMALKVYCWGLLGLASLAFVYRTLLPKFFVRRYHYQIAQVLTPSKGVVRIIMQPLGRRLSFQSGQFLFVSFRSPGFSHEWHPFSISSNTAENGLAITVKGLGKYTNRLVELAPQMVNTRVDIEGAYGRFSFVNFASKRQVWIAGGIGVTPFLSMVSSVTSDYQVDFYYSVKSAEEIIDWPLLQQVAQSSNGAVRIIPCIADRDGFLTADKVAKTSGDLSTADILLCGPPPMMHALHDQFNKLGVNRRRIHSEEFAMS